MGVLVGKVFPVVALAKVARPGVSEALRTREFNGGTSLLIPYANPPRMTRLIAKSDIKPAGVMRIVHPAPLRRDRAGREESFCPGWLVIIGK